MERLQGFVSKDGRTVSVGQKVRVYRNLNKTDFYSIQDYKTKVVLGYARSVTISGGVQFSVGSKPGYYNPYTTPLFINEESGDSILKSDMAHCQGSRVYFK